MRSFEKEMKKRGTYFPLLAKLATVTARRDFSSGMLVVVPEFTIKTLWGTHTTVVSSVLSALSSLLRALRS